jgi:adenylate kinase family enzyme
MIQGIAIFGLNGGGKSTLTYDLAKQIGYFEMDVEDKGATALEVTKNTSYEGLTCKEFLDIAYERAKRLDEFRYARSV